MLKDAHIRKAKTPAKPTKLAEKRGLFFLFSRRGGRFWRFKYRFAGKEKLLALAA